MKQTDCACVIEMTSDANVLVRMSYNDAREFINKGFMEAAKNVSKYGKWLENKNPANHAPDVKDTEVLLESLKSSLAESEEYFRQYKRLLAMKEETSECAPQNN